MELKGWQDAGQMLTRQLQQDQVVRRGKEPRTEDKIRQVSEEFEGLFVEILLRTMRQAIPKSEFIDGGNAEDIYRSMLDSEYAKIIATQDKTGLAAMIEKQLLQVLGKRQLGDHAQSLSQQGLRAYGLSAK